jgi:hypothetical protein
MNRLLASASLVLCAVAVSACVTTSVQSDGLPDRLNDAGIAANAGIASAEDPIDSVRSRLDAMSVDAVKSIYVQCSDQSVGRRLGGGEVAYCSTVYNVLLTRHFGGDFSALLAWSRQQ